jgi:hypothetical protein
MPDVVTKPAASAVPVSLRKSLRVNEDIDGCL